MARPIGRPKSLREVYTQTNAWDRFYALSAGMEPQNQKAVAPKREIVNRSEPGELEAAVMREVADAIALSPQVLIAWRVNSGSILDSRNVPIDRKSVV